MKKKSQLRTKKLSVKKIILVVLSIALGIPVIFTLWLLNWDAGFAVSKHQVLLPGVQLNLQTVTTTHGPVEYDMYGTKGPVILSIHAGLGGADQGRLFASWLQGDGFRILSPSRPGYLDTPLASSKTAEEQADLLVALLDALHIDKVGIIAASAGGPVAYTLAERYPERVWALVSIDSISRNRSGAGSSSALRTAFMDTIGQKLVKLTADISLQSVVSGTLDETSSFTSEQKAQRTAYIINAPDKRALFTAMFNTTFPYDKRTAGTRNDAVQAQAIQSLPFEKIKTPTLIIHGTQDDDVSFYDGVYAYEHIPGAQRYWMEHDDHLGFWLSPESGKAQGVARTFLLQHEPR